MNFWDSNVWGVIDLFGALLLSLLVANLLKKSIRVLRVSLIPTSVLAGVLLLIVAVVFRAVTGVTMFNTEFFGGNGQASLEVITYHFLALGFIASSLSANRKMTKERGRDIFNSGVVTVSGYLVQAVLGMIITIVAAMIIKDFFSAAGVLLPFGYGQGTGQALNYGGIYEADYGFVGGKTFGLSIAALGFISAAIGGVIHLNIMKKKGLYKFTEEEITEAINSEEVQNPDEVPMNGSIDKMTIQIAIIFGVYVAAYLAIRVLSGLVPGFRSVLYGFNFLFGVLFSVVVKKILASLRKAGIVKKQYINPFLMTRICGFCFDLMIVAGVAAIQMEFLKGTWPVLIILGIVGAFATYFYVHKVSEVLFPEYAEAQFLAFYGMLTGTASTGMILLREVDPQYETPAADNLVLQQLPAIVFGFPMMLLATMAPKAPVQTLGIFFGFLIIMQIILFRKQIFRRKAK